ncbi:hypothetical protein K1T71_010441 [Dendrolimus kikuchii]|uniref:Uncharacterized protein n=1 Tax=Dendrolimus kikuchii TaxID=765133 RepID=A0ACC1CRZ9_9NEOP|nr:hypothetical protein K1T71_010441 [Dendrolimus kikuchii]
MEDMARLALVEQSVRDSEKYSKILYELLQHITHILENPHEYELRIIKSNILKDVLKHEPFGEYLKYIGFQSVGNEYTYPKELSLNKLRMAQAAIERKICFCCGSLNNTWTSIKSSQSVASARNVKLKPIKVLTTSNGLLLKLEAMFNNMLVYEDEELQALAKEKIPILTLQLMALDRVREQQRQLKTGEIKGHDLSFDIALLMELLGWFKYKFFSWVDKPECEQCKSPTIFSNTDSLTTSRETCNVEVYKCVSCGALTRFPRYNDLRTLLATRKGRCGEWANCFTLVARTMGYDTRYIYDTTDHVWCEIFDVDSNSWLHCDPCEAKLNAPLIYAHGWKKKLSYVLAFSKDDLQDVTWRYTVDHKEVLKRRTLCDETELIDAILSLREHRQRQVSDARRKYLAKRNLVELVQLMVERKPTDYESHGRISGSKQWRLERGEIGSETSGYTFEFNRIGDHTIQYHSGQDKYWMTVSGGESKRIDTWSAGVFQAKNVFRKEEHDWRKAYLAREEGEDTGSVSWRMSVSGEGLGFTYVSIKLMSTVFETGNIDWTVQFDNETPIPVQFGDKPNSWDRPFKTLLLSCQLTGGVGDVAWQHAQLFRQAIDAHHNAMEIKTSVANMKN